MAKTWAFSTHIDLQGCNSIIIKDKKSVAIFAKGLCAAIKMKPHKKAMIERFGKGHLKGLSMFQFIETSSLSAHFDEQKSRAFIDIFSCKRYDARKAASFCKNFFKARKEKHFSITRR